MINDNRISAEQHRFLREVRDGKRTLELLRNQMELNDKRFARWLRNRFFRARLMTILRVLAEHRFAVIEMAANTAAKTLEGCVDGQSKALPTADVMSACRTLIELAVRQRSARKKQKRKGKKIVPPEERDLCHPKSKHMERELMEILSKPESEPESERAVKPPVLRTGANCEGGAQ